MMINKASRMRQMKDFEIINENNWRNESNEEDERQ